VQNQKPGSVCRIKYKCEGSRGCLLLECRSVLVGSGSVGTLTNDEVGKVSGKKAETLTGTDERVVIGLMEGDTDGNGRRD
jgi:hypothetical protein